MNELAFAVHGGADKDSPFLTKHRQASKESLAHATQAGFALLKQGASALDAVEKAITILEDAPIFNAGRGSALNCLGEVEMDASIMDGEHHKAGAVSMIKQVKNPITLARLVMEQTCHVYLSGYGAMELAKLGGITLEDDDYFMTEHQYAKFKQAHKKETLATLLTKKHHGTVGAVARDAKGNLAAGTSTGGIDNSLAGRIGDSCIIGAGCYASNQTCAVSGTGDGEYFIRGVIAHSIATVLDNTAMTLQQACDLVIKQQSIVLKGGDMGVIAIDHSGHISISYNTELMRCAWMGSATPLEIKVD